MKIYTIAGRRPNGETLYLSSKDATPTLQSHLARTFPTRAQAQTVKETTAPRFLGITWKVELHECTLA
jgi:hypothetical protein